MKKLGMIVASIAGIAGLAWLWSALLNIWLSWGANPLQMAFVTQTSFDCKEVKDVDFDQCLTLYDLYQKNPDSAILKSKFKIWNKRLCGNWVGCKNNKIINLWFPAENISDISSLKNLSELGEIYLVNGDIADISSLKWLSSLYRINLTNNKICWPISSTIDSLIKIKYLTIRNNYLDKTKETNQKVKSLLENDTTQDPSKCITKLVGVNSNVDKKVWGENTRYSCSTSLWCYEDPNGSYTDLKSCNSKCAIVNVDVDEKVWGTNTRYSCSTSTWCYEDPNGSYTDLKSCNSKCLTTLVGVNSDVDKKVWGENSRYSCIKWEWCKADPNGEYADLKSCESKCTIFGKKDPVCWTINGTHFYDNKSKCTELNTNGVNLCADGWPPTYWPKSVWWQIGKKQYWLWSCNGKSWIINPYDKSDGWYSCFANCSYCGDGIVDVTDGEQCDDRNTNNNDTCTNTCKLVK